MHKYVLFYGLFDKIHTKMGTFWVSAHMKTPKIFPGAFGAKAKFFLCATHPGTTPRGIGRVPAPAKSALEKKTLGAFGDGCA